MIRRQESHTLSRAKLRLLLLILIPVINVSEHLLNNYLRQWQLFTQISSSVVVAQSLRPEKVSTQVYKALPDFPQANNYTNRETKQAVPENTLVSRIVRYHQYIKARPTIFRLDWKLTLADYLGKNELMKQQRYPGYSSLTQNPLPNDKQIIANLTMKQREDIVNLLVSIYSNTTVENVANPSVKEENSSPTLENEDSSPSFKLPVPGGANLLLP